MKLSSSLVGSKWRTRAGSYAKITEQTQQYIGGFVYSPEGNPYISTWYLEGLNNLSTPTLDLMERKRGDEAGWPI